MAYYYKIRAEWNQVYDIIKNVYQGPITQIGVKMESHMGECDMYVGVSHPGAIQILDKFCPVVVKEVPLDILNNEKWLTFDEGNYFQLPSL